MSWPCGTFSATAWLVDDPSTEIYGALNRSTGNRTTPNTPKDWISCASCAAHSRPAQRP